MSHRIRSFVVSIALGGSLSSCLGEATIEPADASTSNPPGKPEPTRDASTDANKDAAVDTATGCVPTSFTGTMTVQARSGTAPAVGTSCALTVGPKDSTGDCRVYVVCSGSEWYATGSNNGYLPSCTLTASGFSVAADPQTTSQDGADPALTLSMTSLSIKDDASGVHGAFQFSGAPSFDPVGPGC
jgi:hypothetical protein